MRILSPHQHITELGTKTIVLHKLRSALLVLFCMAPVTAFANDERISIAVDAVELIQIDTPATWVQVGNPDVADVSVNTSEIRVRLSRLIIKLFS